MSTAYLETDYETLDAAQLVRAAQGGNRHAFGELARRYERMVYSVAHRRLGHHGEAQELCQEVFLQAYQKLDALRDPRCFGGWLRAIAGRLAINRAVRRRPRFCADLDTIDAVCAEAETPLGAALARERADQVRLGLGQLRPTDRATLEAFYLRGRSLIEMSEEFDSPVGTIKRRLHVARKRLAERLQAMSPA